MRKYAIQISLMFWCLAFLIGCGTNTVVNEEPRENLVDTSYMIDSRTKAKKISTCDTPYQSVDILIIIDGTIENENLRAFYSRTDKNGNILSGDKPFNFLPKKPYFPFTTVETEKISQKALSYLAEYIDVQCECEYPFPKNDSIRFAGGYTFKLIQNGQTKTCYVFPDNMDLVIGYLKGMRGLVEKSKYKQEFKDLIEYIDYKVKMNREDKLQHMYHKTW